MTHVGGSSVQVSASVSVSGNSSITYHVLPDDDMIQFTLGNRDGLDLDMSEAGLRRCVATFAEALTAFEAAAQEG